MSPGGCSPGLRQMGINFCSPGICQDGRGAEGIGDGKERWREPLPEEQGSGIAVRP